jgi:nucleotide-binding universal stress UspA family protein
MTIRDIFTIIDSYNDNMVAANAALQLATVNQAHVTGVALAMEPLTPGFLASPIPAEYLVEAIATAENNAKDAAARFSAKAAELGVEAEARATTIYSGGTPTIVRQAQLSDLIVVGQDDPEQPEPMRAALIEAMLFDSGVPTLIIPTGWTKPISFERVMVAWDGSSTSARAVHAALPVFHFSALIDIAIVAGSKKWEGEPGADVAAYLARHKHSVTVSTVTRDNTDVCTRLLAHAAKIDADLVIMGGYGHNRFREFVVGGVTREMLSRMTVPTLMMH